MSVLSFWIDLNSSVGRKGEVLITGTNIFACGKVAFAARSNLWRGSSMRNVLRRDLSLRPNDRMTLSTVSAVGVLFFRMLMAWEKLAPG